MSLSQPRAPPSTSRPPSGELVSGGGGVVSKGLPQAHQKKGEMIRDTQIKVSNADTPSLPGFLPTHRPEPRPEPRPGPELPLPSIPAWTGPGIPESGVVEGNEGIDGGYYRQEFQGGRLHREDSRIEQIGM